MPENEIIGNSLHKLGAYISKENYRGYDPFDVLSSPLYSLPFFRSNKLIRLISQQIVKRLPINIRPLLFVHKGLNPVTLGLALQSIASLMQIHPERREDLSAEGDLLVESIKSHSSQGYSGLCWGYDFDWEARYATIPAFCPTIVATGFVTNALFIYYLAVRRYDIIQMCKSATDFVLHDLHRTIENNTFCFSYSPRDNQKVYNATLKGARLLAQVYSITKEEVLRDEAEKTVNYVVNKQRSDGSWEYSYGDTRTWVDNFHTGYVLDCLDEFIVRTGRDEYRKFVNKGVTYYLENFFLDGCLPKFYSNKNYPIDATAAAQAIITLVRFGEVEKATSIAVYMAKTMQDPACFFYYQRHQYWTNKISYMRWSNAWMYAALSALYRTIILKSNRTN